MSARLSVVPVFVPHMGCPNNCVFCDQRRITGRLSPATARTVDEAMEKAAALPRSGAGRQLAFYGGSFTAIPPEEQEALLSAAKAWIDRGALDSLRLSTRPDAIDEATLARLKRFGVQTVELGAQSMDDEVLRLSGRGHTAADVERAARLVKAAGFELILQMMTGLPGDTEEKSLNTARRLIALRPGGVRVYPTVIVRDTALYELWRAGRYKEHSVEDAVRLGAKLLPLFEAAGVPVIRFGLNPTEELGRGQAAGGAYHPALGELVKSRVLYEQARALLRELPPGGEVCLGVPARRLSQALGQRRENVERLRAEFGLKSLRIRPAETKNGGIEILSVEKSGEI